MDQQGCILPLPVQWLRHPPSRGFVRILVALVVASPLIPGLERLFGWRAWLTVDRGARVMR